MKDLVIDQNNHDNNYKVTLPCNPEEFTDFVSSLLGKGLTIEKNYNDIFEIKLPDIQQLYYMVTQRAKQNGGTLVSFNSKIYFSDHSSVSFNSPEDFFNHNEIKKIETKFLSLEMIHLIHFPDKQAPEKQTVAVQFKPGTGFRHRGEYVYSNASEVSLQIHHSEKTWANDIVNLFNDFFSHHTYKPNSATILWNKLNKYIAGLSGFLCFGVGLLGIVIGYSFISEELEEAANLALTSQSASLKYLVLQSFDGTMVNFTVASVFYTGILIFVSAFISDKLGSAYEIPIQSQLIFTDEDKKAADLKEKKSKSQVLGLSSELVKGILIGLLANALFALIWY